MGFATEIGLRMGPRGYTQKIACKQALQEERDQGYTLKKRYDARI